MASIDVPPGFEQMFRFAAVHEIQDDSTWLQQMGAELRKRAEQSIEVYPPKGAGGPLTDDDLGDLRGAAKYWPKALAVLEQAFAEPTPVEITGDAEVLAHVCEGMARWVVPAHMEHIAGPLDGPDQQMQMREAGEALSWATKEAARLYGEVGIEREEGD